MGELLIQLAWGGDKRTAVSYQPSSPEPEKTDSPRAIAPADADEGWEALLAGRRRYVDGIGVDAAEVGQERLYWLGGACAVYAVMVGEPPEAVNERLVAAVPMPQIGSDYEAQGVRFAPPHGTTRPERPPGAPRRLSDEEVAELGIGQQWLREEGLLDDTPAEQHAGEIAADPPSDSVS